MNEPFELELTDITHGGQSLGRHDGKAIFVPYTIPGELITARITEDHGRYAFAEGLRVLDPSADRVLPRCGHFGASHGACSTWQHMDYAAQLALKTDIVLSQLERIGKLADVPIEMCLPSPSQWHYRHEVLLKPNAAGKLSFVADDGNTPFDIENCHLLSDDLSQWLPQLDIDLDTLQQATLRTNGQGQVMLMLSTRDDEPPELEIDLPISVNFLLSDSEPANLIGATHLTYHLNGHALRVTAGSAMRSNLQQVAVLMQLINDWLDLDGQECILDLYGGVGVFSAMLAQQANLITCVDSYPPAMTDAEENLAAYDNVNVIEGRVATILQNIPDDEPYQIAIVDPPAQGLDKDTLDALQTVNLERLIYIADDPATLARDAQHLMGKMGFTLDVVQPLDFEPQTYRTVTVAHFHKD